jgi:hypothetical protein
MKKNALWIARHKESGQEVSIFGFVPFVAGGEAMGGEFLIFTSDGWDFRSVEEFEPIDPQILKLEDA